MKRLTVYMLMLLAAFSAQAESELRIALLPEEISGTSDLGAVEINGVGPVNLTAQKNGNQLIVHARSPDGSVIGKAESVVGLRDTPIYVMTDSGLEKITIFWGRQ